MTRVLVVSHEYVGPEMAGPGIRYYHLARELARSFDVTLVIPNDAEFELDGVSIVRSTRARHRPIMRLARSFDVVFAQFLNVRTMRALARRDTLVIYDLYVPFFSENLGLDAGELVYRAGNLLQAVAIATGNSFVCASEKQRDLWLGVLGAAGRIDLERYRRDPGLTSLIEVVPFGLEETEPQATGPVLKGVVPGIGASDRVLLWGGGLWNWFDPLTAIRAVAEIAGKRDDVKLYFLAGKHPNPEVAEMAMASRARQLAEELGLLGHVVFFHDRWVPYAERAGFFLEADLGVSTHFDNVETRFAFRTRLLDHFWAGLPTVTTTGGALSDLVAERGLGLTVSPEDPHALAAAIVRLLDDDAEYRRTKANIAAVRAQFTWPAVTEGLARLAAGEGGRVSSSWNVDAMVVRYFSLVARTLRHRPELAWKRLRRR